MLRQRAGLAFTIALFAGLLVAPGCLFPPRRVVTDEVVHDGMCAGWVAGLVVGIPLMIAGLPLTFPVAVLVGDWGSSGSMGMDFIALGDSHVVLASPAAPVMVLGMGIGMLIAIPISAFHRR